MRLAEKLQLLRNNNRLSQEELAEKLGISRQAISKWESGQSTPDLKKLIVIAELYNVTIDSLVKDSDEFHILQSNGMDNREKQKVGDKKTQVVINRNRGYSMEYEYKSKRILFGLPLVHINIGRGFKKAKGIISIGNISYGIISVGFISFGILSCGFMSIGLITLALLSMGLLLAVGVMSVGIFSIGAISIGNKVKGINTLPLDTSVEDIKNLIKQEYPNLSKWIVNIIIFFTKYITIRTR